MSYTNNLQTTKSLASMALSPQALAATGGWSAAAMPLAIGYDLFQGAKNAKIQNTIDKQNQIAAISNNELSADNPYTKAKKTPITVDSMPTETIPMSNAGEKVEQIVDPTLLKMYGDINNIPSVLPKINSVKGPNPMNPVMDPSMSTSVNLIGNKSPLSNDINKANIEAEKNLEQAKSGKVEPFNEKSIEQKPKEDFLTNFMKEVGSFESLYDTYGSGLTKDLNKWNNVNTGVNAALAGISLFNNLRQRQDELKLSKPNIDVAPAAQFTGYETQGKNNIENSVGRGLATMRSYGNTNASAVGLFSNSMSEKNKLTSDVFEKRNQERLRYTNDVNNRSNALNEIENQEGALNYKAQADFKAQKGQAISNALNTAGTIANNHLAFKSATDTAVKQNLFNTYFKAKAMQKSATYGGLLQLETSGASPEQVQKYINENGGPSAFQDYPNIARLYNLN